MADNKVTVEFEVVSDAVKKLNEITKSLENLQETSQEGFKKAGSSFKVFEGVIAAEVALKAIGALANAAQDLFQVFIVDGIKAAQEQEEALNALNQALASSGEFSADASKAFQEYATSVQNTTTVSDEAVLSTAALIQQIARLSGQELQQATDAALDLSAALGIDLDSAARLVAKAAEGNVEAFKRYGIEIRKGKTDSESFANTLEALARFQGAAEAKTKTFAGATTQLSNTFNELQESFGNLVIKNDVVIAVLSEVNQIFKALTVTLGQNEGSLKKVVAEGILTAISAIRQLVEVLAFLEPAIRGSLSLFTSFGEKLGATGAAISAAISGNFKGAIDTLVKSTVEANAKIENAFSTSGSLAGLITGLKQVEESANAAFQAMGTGADKTAPKFKNAQKSVFEFTDELKKLLAESQKFFDDLIQRIDPEQELAKRTQLLSEARAANVISEQEYQEALFAQQDLADEKRKELNAKTVEELIAETKYLIEQDTFNLDTANEERILANQRTLETILANEKLNAKSQQTIRDFQLAEEKRVAAERKAVITNLATYQSSKIAAVAAVGKAAAIYNTTIATREAAIQAYKSLVGIPLVGPVLAPIAAGAALAFGAEQIAGILGPQLAGGIDSVPGVGTRDNFPAVLQPGERVVPTKSNQDLTSFLAGRGEDTALLEAIVDRLDRLQNQVIVNVGGRELVNELRDAVASGRTIEAA